VFLFREAKSNCYIDIELRGSVGQAIYDLY